MSPSTVLVTGANRGIGLALVKKFLEDKSIQHVIATARNPEDAHDLKNISDPRLSVVAMEVDNDESIQKAFHEVEKILGSSGLNLLINNAGISIKYDIRVPPRREDLIKQINVNSISPIIVTQVFLPLLQKAASSSTSTEFSPSRAAVVNISSGLGSIALNDPKVRPEWIFPSITGYRMSKSALNSVTRNIANELMKDGILVVSFCPGWVQTDLGGKDADLTLDMCANTLVPSILSRRTEHNGGYFAHTGEVLPY